jgi:hypothetical protein
LVLASGYAHFLQQLQISFVSLQQQCLCFLQKLSQHQLLASCIRSKSFIFFHGLASAFQTSKFISFSFSFILVSAAPLFSYSSA